MSELKRALAASKKVRKHHPRSSLERSPNSLISYYQALIDYAEAGKISKKFVTLLIGTTYWYGCARHNQDIECLALEGGSLYGMAVTENTTFEERWQFLKLWVGDLVVVYS